MLDVEGNSAGKFMNVEIRCFGRFWFMDPTPDLNILWAVGQMPLRQGLGIGCLRDVRKFWFGFDVAARQRKYGSC